MRVAQLAAEAIQHLHTAQTVLNPGRRLRVRWIEDSRGARVELARIRMSLRSSDGTILPEYIDITGIPVTKSDHEAIAVHQARTTLLTAMDKLGRAWVAHPVLGPMARRVGTPAHRQVGLRLLAFPIAFLCVLWCFVPNNDFWLGRLAERDGLKADSSWVWVCVVFRRTHIRRGVSTVFPGA